MKKLYFIFIACVFHHLLLAQAVSYEYDLAGNRIKRQVSQSCDFTITIPPAINNLTPVMGQQTTLTSNCSGAGCNGLTYTWSGMSPAGTGAATTFYLPPVTGTFSYTVTASKAGCTSKTATITLVTQAGGSLVLADGCYTISVYNKYLRPETDAVGARIKVYSPTGNSNQVFELTSVDGNSYKINSASADKVWEPSAPVQEWSGIYLRNWTAATAQKWFISREANNLYYFVSKANPARLMELGGGSAYDGNITLLWTYLMNGGGHQKYVLNSVGCPNGRIGAEEEIVSELKAKEDDPVLKPDKPEIRLYPNPSTDRVRVEVLGTAKIQGIRIFDLKGIKIIESPSASQEGIDIQTLTPGLYIMEVILNDGSYNKYKVLKQ